MPKPKKKPSWLDYLKLPEKPAAKKKLPPKAQRKVDDVKWLTEFYEEFGKAKKPVWQATTSEEKRREELMVGSRRLAEEEATRIVGEKDRRGLAMKAFESWEKDFGILRARKEFRKYLADLDASEMLNPRELEIYSRIMRSGERVRQKALKERKSRKEAESLARDRRTYFLYRLKGRNFINQASYERLLPGVTLSGVEAKMFLYPKDIKKLMLKRLKQKMAAFEREKVFDPESIKRSAREAFAQGVYDYRDKHNIRLKNPLSGREEAFAIAQAEQAVKVWREEMMNWDKYWDQQKVLHVKGPGKRERQALAKEVEKYVLLMKRNPLVKEMREHLPVDFKRLQDFVERHWKGEKDWKKIEQMSCMEVMLRGMGSPFGVERKSRVIELPGETSMEELEIRLGRTESGRKLLKQLKKKKYEKAGKPQK